MRTLSIPRGLDKLALVVNSSSIEKSARKYTQNSIGSRKESNFDYEDPEIKLKNNLILPNVLNSHKNAHLPSPSNASKNMGSNRLGFQLGEDYEDQKSNQADGINYYAENNSATQSPKNRSVRFYSSKAYNNQPSIKESVLDKPEKAWPLDKQNKQLQDHFVSLCDKNHQFAYHNSSLTKQQLKIHLSKRYCRNIVEKILSTLNFPQTCTFATF